MTLSLNKALNRRLPIFLFDIGGVVIIWRNNDPLFRAVANHYGLPFSKMKRVMNSTLDELESGKLSTRAYFEKCLSSFGKKVDSKDDPEEIWAAPFRRGAKDRKGVIQIIKKLKKEGYRVYAFSNTSSPHVPIMSKRGWAEPLFDRFFFLLRDKRCETKQTSV